MNDQEAQVHAAQTIQISHFFSVAATVGFPFAVFSGLAPWPYLISGTVTGALWLSALLLGLRRRSQWPAALGIWIGIIGHKFAQSLLPSEPSPFFFQWLIVMVLTTFGILALCGPAILRVCRIKQGNPA